MCPDIDASYDTMFNHNYAWTDLIAFNYIKQAIFQSAFVLCFELERMHLVIFQNRSRRLRRVLENEMKHFYVYKFVHKQDNHDKI